MTKPRPASSYRRGPGWREAIDRSYGQGASGGFDIVAIHSSYSFWRSRISRYCDVTVKLLLLVLNRVDVELSFPLSFMCDPNFL
jgi:hypothetical protein